MSIDGVNGIKQTATAASSAAQNDGTANKPEKMNSVFQETKTALAIAAEESIKEISVPENQQKTEKISRKDAKEWIKKYIEETGCSKKEAKAAFEQEFGYKMPSSNFAKILRVGLTGIISPIMFPFLVADTISNGKLGTNDALNKFIKEG